MKIFSKLFYIVFVLLLLSVAGLFLASLLPIPGNIKVKIVKSGSMEPAIHTGSIVVVKPQSSYAVGDVITFGEDTKVRIPTTHRIVSVRDDAGTVSYSAKGDANEEADPIVVSKGSVIGKVTFAIPYAGYVLDFARQPLGFTFLIGIPASIIILDETLRIVNEIMGMRRRREPEEEFPAMQQHVIDLRNRKSV